MAEKVFSSGYKPSELDGTEHIFGAEERSMELPKSYSYRRFLPNVLDQGSAPICVPCSISAFLNWRENLADGSKRDNKIKYFDIYHIKTTEGDGMTFKEAFSYLRHHGVDSKAGNLKINEYAMVRSSEILKLTIVMNGPCVGALPVYNYGPEFWKRQPGEGLQGYHAISIVGYNSEGFIIRNSWGSSFGNNGYTLITYADLNKFAEIWTVID